MDSDEVVKGSSFLGGEWGIMAEGVWGSLIFCEVKFAS